MFIILVIFLVVAIGMQVLSIQKHNQVHKKLHGTIKSANDLNFVKETINLSMRFAVWYIILSVVFLIILVVFVASGSRLEQAALVLFIFGVITLPVGLFGKTYEKKIKSMDVQVDDPEIEQKFQKYLKQWGEARYQLAE